ncbi:MAG TPA: dihydrolipoamide acetyltransferase family protein [Galbitalea sp.]|jgi:pyruvate dehydrogenase E2 component (dihydrolipoamide acetyltransferase)|nr:dihydrolipoamide acetyltransferase family protein [Galbitalea sp.]
MSTEFAMPDLGEGLTESELVAWHVAVGDPVELNQPIAEIETAKAIVQLPSPFAGTISQLYAEPGEVVAVGARLVAFDLTDEADAPVERNSVLVGYGPEVETGNRPKRRRGAASRTPSAPAEPATGGRVAQAEPARIEASEPEAPASQASRPRTTPPVRKFAADLGVDLAFVTPSGDDGLITRSDVQAAASAVTPSVAASESAPAIARTANESKAARGTRPRELRIPIKGVRKATAEAMVRSITDSPQATVFVTIDVTATVDLVSQLRQRTGQKINVLAMTAKAVCLALADYPTINSKWDEANQEIIEFGYVNLGIAVATPRGLMVPNIPDADLLNLSELTVAIANLAETARSGATTPKALSGGTFSITNVGVFGVDAGTPILNPGEAAILALGVARRRPWEYRGEIALRDVLTLSLTFDHRLVDGEQGAKFLVDVGAILANPGIALTLV